ncbi:MAG: Type IV pilus biogenesis and competence protein PilQ [Burkholderia plantarii]|nr:MAG: Type IV pilus biogenesis and competence protein PilQ [Burkholderia plantarii]
MKRTAMLGLLLTAAAVTGCAGPAPAAGEPADTPTEAARVRLDTLRRKQRETPDDIALAQAAATHTQAYVRAALREVADDLERGDYPGARERVADVLAHDPGNLRARQLRSTIERREKLAADLARAQRMRRERPQQALDTVRAILTEQPDYREAKRLRDALLGKTQASQPARPQLADALRKPVSLNFREQPIGHLFEAISRVSGVNFVFDGDVRTDQPATLFATDTTAEQAIDLLLGTHQLDKRVLDAHTLLIYPAKPEKRRDYKEFAIRTFFLSHADAKTVMAALRQMVKPKDIYVDERVNAIVVRDTPETIQVAERLVLGLDIAQSEVSLDVQVLEVNMNDSVDLGVQYPGHLQFSALGRGEESALTLGDLLRLNRDRVGVSGDSGALSVAIDMLQKQGKTRTVANPKIRVRNLEKASIKIGERVPIVTTTNGNGVVTESVSYQDVGLMLKVEPRVSLDNEVSVKVNLEVSNILSEQKTKTGLVAYALGTRNAETLMTARNGETQVLAGLIKRSEIESTSGLPWLSSLPVLGRLFGSSGTKNENSEIVLLITPHIERNLELPEAAVTSFLAGTEARVTTQALNLVPPPAAHPEPGPPALDAPIVAPDAGRAVSRAAGPAAKEATVKAPAGERQASDNANTDADAGTGTGTGTGTDPEQAA